MNKENENFHNNKRRKLDEDASEPRFDDSDYWPYTDSEDGMCFYKFKLGINEKMVVYRRQDLFRYLLIALMP